MDWNKVWNDFIALLKESVIVQALLTLGSGTAIIYLYVSGQLVPDGLLNLFYALAGAWLGGKLAMAQSRLRVRR